MSDLIGDVSDVPITQSLCCLVLFQSPSVQVSTGELFCRHSDEFNTDDTTVCNKFHVLLVCSSALDQFLRAAPNPTGPLNLCSFTMLEFACLPTVTLHRRKQFSPCLWHCFSFNKSSFVSSGVTVKLSTSG